MSLLGTVTCGVHSVLFAGGKPERGDVVSASESRAVWVADSAASSLVFLVAG